MKLAYWVGMLLISISIRTGQSQPLYFCLAADAGYYPLLLNAVGSIHSFHYNDLGEIAIFDLGLTDEQRRVLSTIAKVGIYNVELTNPNLLTRYTIRNGERTVPGWYAWKPVIIKQALEMFPYVLFMDVGLAVKQPLDVVFEHLRTQGYFLVKCTRSVAWMSTEYVKKNIIAHMPEKERLLNPHAHGIYAGVIGVTRKRYNDFIKPVYMLSKDLRNFAEDGSNEHCYYEQALLSLYAQKLKLLSVGLFEKFFKNQTGEYVSITQLIDWFVRSKRTTPDMIPCIRYKNG